jgi:truncated hemoglobin YjbI
MSDRLYEQVGGTRTIHELVRIFYERVLADPSLEPFFPNTDIDALRAKQVMFLTMLLGRTRTFSGQDLGSAHAGARAQGLTDEHFDALLGHFGAAMRELKVTEAYIREVLGRIETTRNAVLGRVASH